MVCIKNNPLLPCAVLPMMFENEWTIFMPRLSIAGAMVNSICRSSSWTFTKQVSYEDLDNSCGCTHCCIMLVDVMFLFVRAAIGYSLAFVKVKNLEKELMQMAQDRKRCIDSDEDDQQSQQRVSELKERVKRAIEVQQYCTHSMSTAYARLVLHCSNFENHKEDERFFECIYFFVCSVVKLGVVADHWRPIEEELGFLFRGAQFSANIKLHATTAYQDGQLANSAEAQDSSSTSHSGARSLLAGVATGGGSCSNNNNTGINNTSSSGPPGKKMQSLSTATTKDAGERLKISAGSSAFEVPKSRISHFAPSVPVRRIVAELQTTKNRATRNMKLSQALRDRIHIQRSEDRRRYLEAVMSPRLEMNADTLDKVSRTIDSVGISTRSNNLLSPRISIKSTYTTRSPAVNHLLPTTEERVKLALKGYEQELQEHRNSRRIGSKNSYTEGVPTHRSISPGREFWRK